MKKMQCEVCGSREIKKINDTTFECQSCGIQYDKAEVQKLLVEITGEVKIDHSADIANTLQRAEQFLNDGDIEKAQEYYNRVLDLDPDNALALEAINKISETINSKLESEQKKEKARSSKVKILKHTISPDEGVSCFLRTLKNAPEITPDIYKEIEIMSVTQNYYPFTAVKKQYSGTYEGVACYRKRVPYTDYETKKDYHNKNQDGTYKEVQVAVTKYREEIERQNVNGTFIVDHFGAFSVGEKLSKVFTEITPSKYDASVSNDSYHDEVLNDDIQRNLYNDAILKQLENHVENNYNALKSGFTDISTSEKSDVDGIAILSGDSDNGWINRIDDVFKKESKIKAENTAASLMPGDFHEDAHCTWREKSSNEETFYLPIQIIEYAYRGKFYYSAIILSSGNNIVCSYPCITTVKSAENEAEKAILTAKRKPFPPFLIVLYGFGIISLIAAFWQGVVNGDDVAGQVWLWFGIIPLVPGVIWNIIWKSKKNAALKEQVAQGTSVVEKVKDDYDTEFKKEYEAFFKVFTDLESINEATKNVKSISSYSADLSKIKGRLFESKANKYSTKSGTSNIDVTKDNAGKELDANCTYSLVLVKCGPNKLEVCKIMRELCGIGLASANEIAENGHSLIKNGINAENIQSIANQFQLAGATIEIQKDN